MAGTSNQETQLTVSNLSNSEEFYITRLPIQILHAKQDMERTCMIVADRSGWTRAIAYGTSHEAKLQQGKCVLIKNFQFLDGRIQIKYRTSVYRGSNLQIPEEIARDASFNENTPRYPITTLDQVALSPIKKRMTVKGAVIADKKAHTVAVTSRDGKTETINVREITMDDGTAPTIVTLWREAATTPVTTGMEVLLKDVTVTYNKFHKVQTLTVNSASDIEVVEPRDGEPEAIELLAIASDKLDDVLVLLVKTEKTEREIKVNKPVLLDLLTLPDSSSLDDMVAKLPLRCSATVSHDSIIAFQ